MRSGWLVYSGHVDNRAEIGRRLGRPELAVCSDGEVLAAAYEAWGPLLQPRVVGEYSFVAVDEHRRRIVAGRDALGVRELYTTRAGSMLYFASELEGLLEHLGNEPELDPVALREYVLSGGLPPWRRTIYRAIEQVPPAHSHVIEAGAERVVRAWQPDPSHRIALRNPREYEEALRCVLFESIEAAMRSNGNVAADLSGGLDSSTVTSLCAVVQQGSTGRPAFKAISLADETGHEDESEYQLAVAEELGLERVTFGMENYYSFESDHCFPRRPTSSMLQGGYKRALAEIVKSHDIRVHLSGIGGDQVFCGDCFPPLFLNEWLRDGEIGKWARGMKSWLTEEVYPPRNLWELLRTFSLGDLDGERITPVVKDLPRWFTPAFRSELLKTKVELYSDTRTFDGAAAEWQWRNIRSIGPVLPQLSACEERHPLLYRPLVELMLAIPWELKVTHREDRIIQRRALQGILPEKVRKRRSKWNGSAAMLLSLRKRWPKVRHIAEGRHLGELGIVEPKKFYAACERLRHGLFSGRLHFFFAALSLEAWLAQRAGEEVLS